MKYPKMVEHMDNICRLMRWICEKISQKRRRKNTGVPTDRDRAKCDCFKYL